MDRLLDISILALASWRCISLLTYERGPFHFFQAVREQVGGIVSDAQGHPAANPSTFWGELLSCNRCASIWVGAFWAVGYAVLGGPVVWVALPFALSALALWWEKQVR